jgi:PAS domain-containing protein
VTVEYGGSEEQVIIVLVLHCLMEPSALLVTDAKGRIQFANTELGQIVGYRPQTLTEGMNLSALLPPPYAQLHATFMKVRRELQGWGGLGPVGCYGGGDGRIRGSVFM